MRDRGTTFCVDGKCSPNDQTSAPLFNPLLWGAIPASLSKGMSWPATIDRAWEIGPAGTETVRVTALDPAAGLITLERRGQGTGLSSDDAAKRPVMLTISGKPVAATVTPGPSSWQGSLTVIHGKTIADEIKNKISMELAFRDPSKDKEPTPEGAPPPGAAGAAAANAADFPRAQGEPSGK